MDTIQPVCWHGAHATTCPACHALAVDVRAQVYPALADLANRAAGASRRPGAPRLTGTAPLPRVLAWLAWNDPNGTWIPCADGTCAECPRCCPLTLHDAWTTLADMLEIR
jgi:hypothetical protein